MQKEGKGSDGQNVDAYAPDSIQGDTHLSCVILINDEVLAPLSQPVDVETERLSHVPSQFAWLMKGMEKAELHTEGISFCCVCCSEI